MRRLLMVALLGAALVVVTAVPALAVAPARSVTGGGGVAVDPTVCTVLADGSGMFAWRPSGVCWFTPPAL